MAPNSNEVGSPPALASDRPARHTSSSDGNSSGADLAYGDLAVKRFSVRTSRLGGQHDLV